MENHLNASHNNPVYSSREKVNFDKSINKIRHNDKHMPGADTVVACETESQAPQRNGDAVRSAATKKTMGRSEAQPSSIRICNGKIAI